jgi:hypothetical protein
MTGADITHVPYKGSGPAQADFLGGHVPLMVDSVTSACRTSRAARRCAGRDLIHPFGLLPDVPAVRETGVPGAQDFEAVGWLGLMAPKGTPAAMVERLNREVVDILKSEKMARGIRDKGSEPAPTTGRRIRRLRGQRNRQVGQDRQGVRRHGGLTPARPQVVPSRVAWPSAPTLRSANTNSSPSANSTMFSRWFR